MRLLSTPHKAFSLVEIVIVLAVVVFLDTGLVATLMGRRDAQLSAQWRGQCAAHLEQLGLSMGLYTQDYDGKYPFISNGSGQGWIEPLIPYSNQLLFHCPAGSTPQPDGPNYFFNARLGGIEAQKIRVASQTIVIGDGDGTLSQTLTALPDSWRKQSGSPSFRHDGGAYYSFADGHYQWEKPEKIDSNLASKIGPSFNWR